MSHCVALKLQSIIHCKEGTGRFEQEKFRSTEQNRFPTAVCSSYHE